MTDHFLPEPVRAGAGGGSAQAAQPPGAGTGVIEAAGAVLERSAPPEALRTQQALSVTRQQLGAKLEQQAGLQHQAGDAVLAGAHAQQLERLSSEIATLRATLDALVATESTQPREDVERASFEVFVERFGELERAHGSQAAARLARQGWYNDRKFNVAGGSRPATEAQLLAAGLPTAATMRSPSGERIDMGHVACALDWQLNPSPYHHLVDLEEVTLTGDLAAAAQASAERGLEADAALAQQAGPPDLLGDYDGLNLAARVSAEPGLDVSAHLRAYYADGPSDRLTELAGHSRFFLRDGAGVPQRDGAGRLRVNREALTEAVADFALRMDVVGYASGKGATESALTGAVDRILQGWALDADVVL